MAEHLRALVVIMVLSVAFFYVARGAFAQLVPEETFARWRNLWFTGTLLLFLSHSLWVWMFAFLAVLLVARRREPQIMGLYFALLFVAPPAPATLPGMGIIDHLWVLDHYRLLGLALLLPAALALAQRRTTARLGSSPVDWMVIGYVVLMSLLTFRNASVTGALRAILSVWVDIFLPYYVASRSIQSREGLKQAMTGYVMAAMLLSVVAIFEALRSWKLYSAVLGALGLHELLFGLYQIRAGMLRPNATVGNSIVLGFAIMVGLGFFLYLKEFVARPALRVLGGSLLAAGIVASLSRGPWVGALFLVLVYLLVSPRPIKRLMRAGALGVLLLLALSLTGPGTALINLLPFIGTSEQGNVEYRDDLVESAMPVIMRHLFLGSDDYLSAPELQPMLQGEGIIDIVNSYVQVALKSGLLGLFFFTGAFLTALIAVRKAAKRATRQRSAWALPGNVLFATLAATMFTIYTVSSILTIPVVYWPLIGVAVAYARLAREPVESQETTPALHPARRATT